MCKYRPQTFPLRDITQTAGDHVKRALAKCALINIKEFPDKKIMNTMRVMTPKAPGLDTTVVIIVSRFTILLKRVGMTFRTTNRHIEVTQINFFIGPEIFYGFAQRSYLLVFFMLDKYLMTGNTDISPSKPAMTPAQYKNTKQ
jgi:hypothetical protein